MYQDIIVYVKIQKNKIYYPLCQTYSATDVQIRFPKGGPTCCMLVKEDIGDVSAVSQLAIHYKIWLWKQLIVRHDMASQCH